MGGQKMKKYISNEILDHFDATYQKPAPSLSPADITAAAVLGIVLALVFLGSLL